MIIYVSMVVMTGFAVELTDKVILLGIRFYIKNMLVTDQFIIQSLVRSYGKNAASICYRRSGSVCLKAANS
jgi:hypothetical protein